MLYKTAVLCLLLSLCAKAMDDRQVIYVKTMKMTLDYRLNGNNPINTIGDLKNAITADEGIPVDQQALHAIEPYWYFFSTVNNRQLADNLPVGAVMKRYNTDTLQLYLRLRR